MRVRRVAHTLIATITAKYASATPTMTGLRTVPMGPAAPPFCSSASSGSAMVAVMPDFQ